MGLSFGTDLTGKVAVVTGAGGVLCGMFAKTLAEAGAKVAVLDLNEEAAGSSRIPQSSSAPIRFIKLTSSKRIPPQWLLNIGRMNGLKSFSERIKHGLRLNRRPCFMRLVFFSLLTHGRGF